MYFLTVEVPCRGGKNLVTDGRRFGRESASLREVLFEFYVSGKTIRVVAIDPVTNTEVTMVGAPGYSEQVLKRLAARKLEYVMTKKQNARNSGG
jgi:hypothetical protein